MKLDKNTMKKIVFLIAFAITFYMLLANIKSVGNVIGYLFGIALPIVLGFFIAFVLNVPLRTIEKHLFTSKNKTVQKIKRPVSILLSILIVVAIVTGVLWLVIPELIKTVQLLVDIFPDFVEKIKDKVVVLYNKHPEIKNTLDFIGENKKEITGTFVDFAKTAAGGILGSTFSIISSFFGGVINVVLGFIFAVYILANKEGLKFTFKKILKVWFPDNQTNKVFHVCAVANNIFAKFVVGQFTEAVILGTLCMLGMVLFRFPYAGMVGALVGITALIPVVGGFIGAGVGAFMIMMEDPIKAILFIAYIIILQQIEGNLIYPKVVGSSVGLPAMWVLAAVTIGGGLAGIMGMLIGVPVASTIYYLLKENVNSRYYRQEERKKRIEKLMEIANEEKTEQEVKVISHNETTKDGQ
ncbi:MAG: AI-2E family transporter [Ruminococcus sp.]|nr:AI-2E family transporter [Ruminococcus sp.]